MIRKEIAVFLVVGTVTVLVDFVAYRGLLASGVGAVGAAKATGFVAGTLFSYAANRWWTFGHKQPVSGTALRFAALYAVTLGVNVVANDVVLRWLPPGRARIPTAFISATALSAVLNFIGMKVMVFKERKRQ